MLRPDSAWRSRRGPAHRPSRRPAGQVGGDDERGRARLRPGPTLARQHGCERDGRSDLSGRGLPTFEHGTRVRCLRTEFRRRAPRRAVHYAGGLGGLGRASGPMPGSPATSQAIGLTWPKARVGRDAGPAGMPRQQAIVPQQAPSAVPRQRPVPVPPRLSDAAGLTVRPRTSTSAPACAGAWRSFAGKAGASVSGASTAANAHSTAAS